LSGLTCLQGDLTGLDIASGSLSSVSCMHVIEHIGLGRYGDALDPCGDLRAIGELKRIVAPAGLLYMVVPTGLPCIAFNAHRVYAAEHFVTYFSDAFVLEDFYFVPGPGIFAPMSNPPLAETRAWDYGCGCYLFRKTGSSQRAAGPFAALADRFKRSAARRERR
jgi:SAM-dependent methyltransferase